jgi:formylglycine-generating enzyme required for sulfatase activity
VRAWLEGARRRERAVALADEARALRARAAAHEEQAGPAQAAGEALLRSTPTWAGEDAKAPAWAELDRAAALRRSAVRDRLEAEALLDAALTHAPDWRTLRSELTLHHLAEHAAAERAGDDVRAERAALRLRRHAATLPPDDPLRRRAERWLRGTGAVTLVTDPPGATVTAHRTVSRGRRWVDGPGLPLGATPLLATQLERGSWLLVVEHPARAPLRVPVELERGGEWTGVPPGEVEPWPLRLPRPGELGPDDVLVPAGWFRVGGDPLASAAIPGRRLWCDAFVIRRFPLTNREARALGWPADGPDDHPVVHVDWPGAGLLAAREAARTGLPWRLPAELEWEKAGRGVDCRPFPWGDTFEASYARLGDSHAGPPALGPVGGFPHDESPYGVRGLAGNVRDWCADPWRPEGPATPGDRVAPALAGGPTDWRVRRGGSWGDAPSRARLADRDWYHPHYRYDYLGVRLVRSAP